jgi:hypothetical protein
MFLTSGIATGGCALIQQCHVGRLGTGFEFAQLRCVVHLETEVIESWLAATGRDGEIHARIVEHPLGVIDLDAGWLGCKELGIEANACGEVINMHMDVESFHGVLLGLGLAVASRLHRTQASGSLAAVLGEVAQQFIHGRERRSVNKVAPLALLADEARLDKLLQVEGQRVGGNIELIDQHSRNKSVFACNYQSAKDSKAHFLSQGSKGSNSVNFFHDLTIQQI